jgi:hypothetical protein
VKKRLRPRFRGACIAGVVTGVVLGVVGMVPSTAGATQPEDNAAQVCDSALKGSVDPQLELTTDPVGGTTVVAGDTIDATLTWGAEPGNDVWANISVVQICFMVDGVLEESSIFVEKPGVDDGTASTTFTVPEGAVSEVCVHGRVSGAPGPDNLTDTTHKSGQTCFPVGGDTPFECPEGTDWTDTNGDQLMSEDECSTPPTDGCPDVEGMQAAGADCDAQVLPRVLTPSDPATPAAAPAEVEAATALPTTGANTAPMAELALALIALGGVLVNRSRRTTRHSR